MSLTNFELRRYLNTLDARMKPLKDAMAAPNPSLTQMGMIQAAHDAGILIGILQAKQALIDLMNEAEAKRQVELEKLRDLYGLNANPCDEQKIG